MQTQPAQVCPTASAWRTPLPTSCSCGASVATVPTMWRDLVLLAAGSVLTTLGGWVQNTFGRGDRLSGQSFEKRQAAYAEFTLAWQRKLKWMWAHEAAPQTDLTRWLGEDETWLENLYDLASVITLFGSKQADDDVRKALTTIHDWVSKDWKDRDPATLPSTQASFEATFRRDLGVSSLDG